MIIDSNLVVNDLEFFVLNQLTPESGFDIIITWLKKCAKHIQAHYDAWEKYNEQIEAWKPGDPIVEYRNIVTEPHFANPEQPRVCGSGACNPGWGGHCG